MQLYLAWNALIKEVNQNKKMHINAKDIYNEKRSFRSQAICLLRKLLFVSF